MKGWRGEGELEGGSGREGRIGVWGVDADGARGEERPLEDWR